MGPWMIRANLVPAIFLTGATAIAQPPVPAFPPLPPLLANCKPVAGLPSNGRQDFGECFATDGAQDNYGRLFVRFEPATFDLQGGMAQASAAQRQSLLARVRAFFVPHTREGSLVATFTLKRAGVPDRVIGKTELAQFRKSNSGGITITQSTYNLNGFYGPAFIANANTQVVVDLKYSFNRTQFSNISALIGKASTLLSGEGFLGSSLTISSDAQKALASVEDAITQNFNVKVDAANAIQLSFQSQSTMAAYRSITFGGAVGQPGQLIVGAVRLRSVLVDAPADERLPVIYSNGGYGTLATNPIANRLIQGGTLRDYVRAKLGGDYPSLSASTEPAKFLDAATKLRDALTDSSLQLNAGDQLAAQWAFIAGNPLLKDASIRANYALQASEQDLVKLKLDLPAVGAVPLTRAQQTMMAAALSAAERADQAAIDAQQVINRATQAATRAELPVPPPDYVRLALGAGQFRGEAVSPQKQFHGVYVVTASARQNDRYDGALVLSGATPIFEGSGRYIPATNGQGYDYRDYTGQFVANWFSGAGVMRWANGREFRGEFSQDKPNGYGVLSYSDGRRYYAWLVDGRPQGAAVLNRANGDLVAGSWVAGSFLAGQ